MIEGGGARGEGDRGGQFRARSHGLALGQERHDLSCWARGRNGPVALALTFPFLLLPRNAGQELGQFSTLCLFLDLMKEDEEPLQMCVSPLKALWARHGHPMGKLGKRNRVVGQWQLSGSSYSPTETRWCRVVASVPSLSVK